MGVISNNATNSGSAVNHSFHIYDTETDSFVDYNLGNDHIPVSFYWDKKEIRYFGVQVETSKSGQVKEEDVNNESEEDDT